MIEVQGKAGTLEKAEKALKFTPSQQVIMDSLPYPAMLIHKDRIVVAINKIAEGIGVEVGTYCWDTFGKLASIPDGDKKYIERHNNPPECGTKCYFCLADKALEKKEPINKDIQAGGKVWDTYWVPVSEEIFLHYAIDISEKKESPSDFSLDWLDRAQKIAHLGIWDQDIKSDELWWSDETYKIFGLAPQSEKMDFKKFLKLVHSNDRQIVERQTKLLLESGDHPYSLNYRISMPDGLERIVHEEALVTRNDKGEAVKMVGIIQDITERELSEDMLRESEHKFRSVTQTANDAIIAADSKGDIIFWNECAKSIFGYEEKEVIGRPITILMPERFRNPHQNGLDKFTSNHESKVVGQITELFGLRKDGDEFPIELSLSSWRADNSIFFTGIIRDITNRKKVEDRLRLTQFSVDSMADSVAWINPLAEFEYVSDSLCNSLGYSREELLSMKVHDIDPDFQADVWSEHWEELKKSGTFCFESRHRTKDGRLFPVEVTANYVEFEGKEYNCAFARDVTARKKMMQELKDSHELLEKRVQERTAELVEANKLKDKFVSLVSHDLKGPLTSILGYIQFLRSKDLEEEERKKLYDRVIKSGENMTTLIENILDLSRLKSGSVTPKSRFIDAFLVAERSVADFTHLADTKGIQLLNKVSPKSYLFADSTLFSEVIQNLVSNSIKFSNNGGCVTIYMPDEKQSTIAVSDTGVGINLKRLNEIFDANKKTSTVGTDGEIGTGFGLPLSREIMEAHGGELLAESVEEKGTTFFATLPNVRPKILVVDDDKFAHELILLMLRELDAEIIEARNGKEALDSLKIKTPHLIVTDIKMPVMDGFEMIKKIKDDRNTNSIPIMVITSDNNPEARQKSFQLGVQDFILKPLMHGDISKRVKILIGYE